MALSSPGEAMRRLRVERGLDVAAVAAMTGLEAARIEDVESDVTTALFEEALMLAKAYGMVIDEFAWEVHRWKRPKGSASIAELFRDVIDTL
jgi:transcriptional regulator with XRE-family HTH domain